MSPVETFLHEMSKPVFGVGGVGGGGGGEEEKYEAFVPSFFVFLYTITAFKPGSIPNGRFCSHKAAAEILNTDLNKMGKVLVSEI